MGRCGGGAGDGPAWRRGAGRGPRRGGEPVLVAVAGMSHRSAPVEVRERVAFPPCAGRGFLRRLKDEGVVAEAVLLSTCNRTEVYAVVEEEGARTGVLDLLAEDRGVERTSLEGC